MGAERSVRKRIVGGIYSLAAKRIYEPVVIRGAFRLLGRNLNDLVIAQGRTAVATADEGPVLDMPVGNGYFATRVANVHQGIVVGADIAWGMVAETAAAGRARALTNLVVAQADAHRLPFRDGTFAAILCSNGLQVIPGLDATVRELARVVAPGGRVYLSVVSVPLGSLLTRNAAARLPALLRPGRDVVAALTQADLQVESVRRERLATLIEAVAPIRAAEESGRG